MFYGQLGRNTVTIFELLENNIDLGLKDYAIFNEEYRPILNNAIIQAYKFREIGFINPAIFIDRLNYRMDLIMRNKYNALYEAKMTDFNPLFNVDMTETFSHEINNNSSVNVESESNSNSNSNSTSNSTATDTNNSNSDSLNLSSQFPSEELTENDLSDNLFVDSANKQKANATSTDNSNSESESNLTSNDITTNNSNQLSNGNMIETYTKKTEGSSAGLPFSKALIQLKEFYEKYDLDRQVIDDLRDLFYGCY